MTNGPGQPLEALLRHRWNIAVLAEIGRSGGAKFITLSRRQGISRGSLTASLKHLVVSGLVRRNSGYGHPLRPEYLLTGAGQAIAPACIALDEHLAGSGQQSVAYRKWSLPLVLVIDQNRCRFSNLKESLPGITSRALVLGLKALEKAGWVDRQVDDGYPPTTAYALGKEGRKLLDLVRALAQSAGAVLNSS